MSKPTLYLMLGYPGAGKTTTAKIIAGLTGAIHLSSDALRLELFPHPDFTQAEHDKLYQTLDKKTEELLKKGQSVIYDANLNRYRHRAEKYKICEQVGARPILIWLDTPRSLSKDRAMHDSRKHLWPPAETPDQMFERIAGVIEEPKPNESAIILNGSNLTPEIVKAAISK